MKTLKQLAESLLITLFFIGICTLVNYLMHRLLACEFSLNSVIFNLIFAIIWLCFYEKIKEGEE